jgi:hypothetical protein
MNRSIHEGGCGFEIDSKSGSQRNKERIQVIMEFKFLLFKEARPRKLLLYIYPKVLVQHLRSLVESISEPSLTNFQNAIILL